MASKDFIIIELERKIALLEAENTELHDLNGKLELAIGACEDELQDILSENHQMLDRLEDMLLAEREAV